VQHFECALVRQSELLTFVKDVFRKNLRIKGLSVLVLQRVVHLSEHSVFLLLALQKKILIGDGVVCIGRFHNLFS
jgi:hypothetical protein